MKVLLAGVGRFGAGWYELLKQEYGQLKVVVAEPDRIRAEQVLRGGDRLFESVEEAIRAEQPDFLLNATPPAVHTPVNELAFEHRLPVLCEKPIAEDYREAVRVVERAEREGILLMVAENYRRSPRAQQAKRLLDQEAIGTVTAMQVNFFRSFPSDKPYLLAMPNPLLVDVSVHHLDLLRYLTGSEGRLVFARNYHPEGSPYPGKAAVNLMIEMVNGVQFSYTGSLSTGGIETPWFGQWRIEGTDGVMQVGEGIRVVRGEQEEWYAVPGELGLGAALDDFMQALADGSQPESSGRDYLKSQRLVHAAEESDRRQEVVTIEWGKESGG